MLKKNVEIDNEKDRKRMLEKVKEETDYIYIGESSRSAHERGTEHSKDYEYLRVRSHMLKHVVLKHGDSHPNDVEFRMKIVSQHQTAFERQISEAVRIRRNLGDRLMNSKQEYNRCYIPKISIKKSENDDEKDPGIEQENKAKETIKMMKNKWRRKQDEKDEKENDENKRPMKRMKLEEEPNSSDSHNGRNLDSNGEIRGDTGDDSKNGDIFTKKSPKK